MLEQRLGRRPCPARAGPAPETLLERLNRLVTIRENTEPELAKTMVGTWGDWEEQDTKLLRYFAGTLTQSFRLSGPLWSKSEGDRLTLNAVTISHAKFGTLLTLPGAGKAADGGLDLTV